MTEERLKEIEQFNSEPQPKGYNPCQGAELWELIVEVKRLRAGLESLKQLCGSTLEEGEICRCPECRFNASIDSILSGEGGT